MWWFFLFWLPKFLHERFGVSLLEHRAAVVMIYRLRCRKRGRRVVLLPSSSSVAGAWIRRAKASIFVFGLLAVPIFWAAHHHELLDGDRPDQPRYGRAPGLFGQHLHDHERHLPPWHRRVRGWPVGALRRGVRSIDDEFVGFILTTTGSYTLLFSMFSFAYIVAWIILKVGIR